MVDVSIIYVNYFTFDLLRDSIVSVKEKSDGFTYEIIIVDNSVNDEEFAKLKEFEKEGAIVIQAPENLGFGKANNLGASKASGRYLYFLNGDTLLMNNAIFEMSRYLDEHPECGIVGSNLYSKEGSPNHSFYANEKSIRSEKNQDSALATAKKVLLKKRKDFNYGNEPRQINGYVCGASLMMRRDLFNRLGGFDKDIFMYAEEALLCYRAIHECGIKIYNIPSAQIIHLEGASFKSITWQKAKTMLDGSCIYYLKAFGKEEMLRYLRFVIKNNRQKARIAAWTRKKVKRDSYLALVAAAKDKLKTLEENQ